MGHSDAFAGHSVGASGASQVGALKTRSRSSGVHSDQVGVCMSSLNRAARLGRFHR